MSDRGWPKSIVDDIWERDGGRCVYCGTFAQVIDHVVPYSKGGPTRKENGVLACVSCNMKKFDRVDMSAMTRAFTHLLNMGESLGWLDKPNEDVEISDDIEVVDVQSYFRDKNKVVVEKHTDTVLIEQWPCQEYENTAGKGGCFIDAQVEVQGYKCISYNGVSSSGCSRGCKLGTDIVIQRSVVRMVITENVKRRSEKLNASE